MTGPEAGALWKIGGGITTVPAGYKWIFVDNDGVLKTMDSALTKGSVEFAGFKRGADLGDADVTLQPFVDKVSLYVLPANTLTANRTFTLGNTSAPGAGLAWVCAIVRLDRGAFTVTIKKADTTTIYVDPISPAYNTCLQFGCSAGIWGVSQGVLIP